jgi:HSP20 family protein
MTMTTLRRWNPLRDIHAVQSEFDRLFEPFFSPVRTAPAGPEMTGSWMPPVDIEETSDRLFLRAELPGFRPEEVDIEFENGVLTIRGERRFENQRNDRHFHRIERSYGTFARSFALPSTIDPDQVSARFDNGILELEMAKRENAKPRRITITNGSNRELEAKVND